jgi:hypothetical protein
MHARALRAPLHPAAGTLGAKWPNFTWINTDPAIYKGNYQHWGTYQPGKRLEPNNMAPPENCAGSNTTQGVLQADKTTVRPRCLALLRVAAACGAAMAGTAGGTG